ncbi:hypothetical protein [Candidatus Xianfuyuplasma coldseepsis]|uniref:Yip1 domain-containing protein n=1 Tax=Candidatus Xianfuyuplasma coldseepsis TaxID=2782163 RepID=A0A7L7KSZ2_9MOLU|nr:hypothetical protein [Xianfuyuplasma coldseepsis]QMS85064.1 hypothetical protein G4Z02_04675 [Xianfuyuplasma coldseepsis]
MRLLRRSLLIVLFLLLLQAPRAIQADTPIQYIPYRTYTIGLESSLVRTATAYEGTFILNEGFSAPQDIFILDDVVYIADTGNGRIYMYNQETREHSELTHELLAEPTGIFLTDEGELFIADAATDLVLHFDADLQFVRSIGRPDEPLFGTELEAPYEPYKVAVDERGYIYVITEGGSNGIIQMDANGDFLGYFGINDVTISLQLLINRALMSEEQREKFASLRPKPATNMAIDTKGLLYTITRNEYVTPLKKLNIEGNNILTEYQFMDPNYQDITIDGDGNIYTVSSGEDVRTVISVFDSFGNLLFTFGRQEVNSLRNGEFELATGVAVDNRGDVWVLDGQANNVQVFSKTEFANLVLSAIEMYKTGQYEQSEILFKEIIRQNSLFAIAHSRLGKIYERNEEFELSLESYRIANNKEGYSNAYWEIRDAWISAWIMPIVITFIVLYAGVRIFDKTRYKDRYVAWKQELHEKLLQYELYNELRLQLSVLKHPIEAVYHIKYKQRYRLRTAVGMYVIFILLNILSNYYIRGYLFKNTFADLVFSYELLKWSVPVLLFGVANYLVSTLQNGEAFYRDIFIGFVFALTPIFLFKIPIDILSNVLTYNEAFVFQFSNLIMMGYSIVLLLVMIKELNNFKYGELFVNIFLTFFVMIIAIILYLIVSILLSQLFEFIFDIFREVFIV